MTDRTSGGQQKLEAHVAKTLQENNIQQKNLINGMMQADDAGCCFADKIHYLCFPRSAMAGKSGRTSSRRDHMHGIRYYDCCIGPFFCGQKLCADYQSGRQVYSAC